MLTINKPRVDQYHIRYLVNEYISYRGLGKQILNIPVLWEDHLDSHRLIQHAVAIVDREIGARQVIFMHAYALTATDNPNQLRSYSYSGWLYESAEELKKKYVNP